MHEHQLIVVCWQTIVNHHLNPPPITPEVETKYSSISILEVLSGWNDLTQEVRKLAKAGNSCQQPTVTYRWEINQRIFVSSLYLIRNNHDWDLTWLSNLPVHINVRNVRKKASYLVAEVHIPFGPRAAVCPKTKLWSKLCNMKYKKPKRKFI